MVRMVRLAIRCHPRVPASDRELERWLEAQVDDLRARAARATIRLSRIGQEAPDGDLHLGWLVELESDDDEPIIEDGHLRDALRDMRLLGLHPTLLAPARFPGDRRVPGAGDQPGNDRAVQPPSATSAAPLT